MERVMEVLETRCYEGMQEAMKNVGLVGIEYDEDVVCDICRSVSHHIHFFVFRLIVFSTYKFIIVK